MAKIGLIFDDISLPFLKTGNIPRTSMSHDFNLFQLGHHALKMGHDVYFGSTTQYYNNGAFGRLTNIYPELEETGEYDLSENIKPDVLFSNHIQVFAWGQLSSAKKVAIHPALYFVEMPDYYTAEQTRAQLLAARYHVDFISVQNDRMKEILLAFYGWLAGWSDADRILVSPLSIIGDEAFSIPDRDLSRRFLQLRNDDISIVNGGGIWRWTGFNDFLRGFIAAARKDPKLVLVMTGFRQAENADHGSYIAETREILRANSDIVGDRVSAKGNSVDRIRIHVEEDWQEASLRLPKFLSGADFGLNVNQNGLENWQAQRVRCLDYTKYSLPLLTTPGDYFSDHVADGGAIRMASSDPGCVTNVLLKIAGNPSAVQAARLAASETRKSMVDSSAMASNLEAILKAPKRVVDKNHEVMLEGLWRSESESIRNSSVSRIRNLIGL